MTLKLKMSEDSTNVFDYIGHHICPGFKASAKPISAIRGLKNPAGLMELWSYLSSCHKLRYLSQMLPKLPLW